MATCSSQPLLFTTATDGVIVHLHYDTHDPFAVHLCFPHGITWPLPRDVFDPTTAPHPITGAALAAVWQHDELHLTLQDQRNTMTLIFSASNPDLCDFLAVIDDLVPPGSEPRLLDPEWDRLLVGGEAA